MVGIKIIAENNEQFLKVIVAAQPCVVALKRPVNEGFYQIYFVAKWYKTQKISKHAREGLFAISGNDREVWGFVVLQHIEKRWNMIFSLLHSEINIWVLIVDEIKENVGVDQVASLPIRPGAPHLPITPCSSQSFHLRL